MPYTATEQALYDHAKGALPRWLFQNANAKEDMFGAYVKIFDSARTQIAEWVSLSYLASATGVWLDQHAKDRGTTRQANETDATLRARLKTSEDAVTRPYLLSTINSTVDAAGVSGDAYMVELRRDRGFFGDFASTSRNKAYFSRGYRMGKSGRPMRIIIILPYGSTTALKNSIDVFLQLRKPAGYSHTVEVRANP